MSQLPFEDENGYLPLQEVVIGIDTEAYLEARLDPGDPTGIEDLEDQRVLTESAIVQFREKCRDFLVTAAIQTKARLPFDNRVSSESINFLTNSIIWSFLSFLLSC